MTRHLLKSFQFTPLYILFRESFPKGLRDRKALNICSALKVEIGSFLKESFLKHKCCVSYILFQHSCPKNSSECRVLPTQSETPEELPAFSIHAESVSVVLITHATASCSTLINEEIIKSIILNSSEPFMVKRGKKKEKRSRLLIDELDLLFPDKKFHLFYKKYAQVTLFDGIFITCRVNKSNLCCLILSVEYKSWLYHTLRSVH